MPKAHTVPLFSLTAHMSGAGLPLDRYLQKLLTVMESNGTIRSVGRNGRCVGSDGMTHRRPSSTPTTEFLTRT